MKRTPLGVVLLLVSAGAGVAQSGGRGPGYSAYGAGAQVGRGGSSVAYDQPLYYTPRLGPSRYYPPSPYGYVEVSGRVAAPARPIRTGR